MAAGYSIPTSGSRQYKMQQDEQRASSDVNILHIGQPPILNADPAWSYA